MWLQNMQTLAFWMRKSDAYSFGVLLLEAITGRAPVDYGRPASEVL